MKKNVNRAPNNDFKEVVLMDERSAQLECHCHRIPAQTETKTKASS